MVSHQFNYAVNCSMIVNVGRYKTVQIQSLKFMRWSCACVYLLLMCVLGGVELC